MVLTQKRTLFLLLVWVVGAVVAVGAGLLAFRLVGGGGDPGAVPKIAGAESAEAPLAAAEVPVDPGVLPEETVVVVEPVPGGAAPALAPAPAPAPGAPAPAPAPAPPAPAPAPAPEPFDPAPVAPASQEPPAPAPAPSPAAAERSASPEPTASSDPSVATFQNNGGTVEVKCHGERPALIKATPEPRWAVERTREELDSLEVRFHSEEDDSRIAIVCENARPVVESNE